MEYYCEICCKKYVSYKSLWIHKKRYHSVAGEINIIKLKQKMCEYCDKKFTRPYGLKNI